MIDPKIKISLEKPPNWNELEEAFDVKWGQTAVAYGDTLHISVEPTEDVLQHEMVHLAQQGFTKQGAENWWRKYMKDPKFRITQEIQAYQRQYGTLRLFIHDRNDLAKARCRLARDLSGPMYGRVISYQGALRAIKI